MDSGTKQPIWRLKEELDAIVEKLLERIKEDLNPNSVEESNQLFYTHIELRYVMCI